MQEELEGVKADNKGMQEELEEMKADNKRIKKEQAKAVC